MKKKKILFTIGSLNQTTQMHQIASHLREYDCYYSQLFVDNPVLKYIVKIGLAENSILSGTFKKNSEIYLKENNLPNDYRAEVYGNHYDLIVMCNDVIIPGRFKNSKLIFIQEGMTDPMRLWSKIVKTLHLPAFFTVTSLNGSLNRCDIYCVASGGYKEKFSKGGTDPAKIVVTGIPNFDYAASYLNNDFIHKDYVLVATSDIRETYGYENRNKFINNCVQIASGRRLIFKLHPNENHDRAIREIKKYTPSDTLVYTTGSINPMIANCSVLITQYSSVAYIGMVLGKEVYSYFDMNELKKLLPEQNNGASVQHIASICRSYIEFNGTKKAFLNELAKNNFSVRQPPVAA